MKPCNVTIITETDGSSTTIRRDAEMKLGVLSAFLRYRDEDGSTVTLKIEKDEALLSREGDYSLHIPLKEKTKQKAALGIGGSTGEISVLCRKIGYTIRGGTLMASLQYAIDYGAELQEMHLRITAREKRTEEK